MDEEVVLLEEQLAAAHREVEELRVRLAAAESLARSSEAAVQALQQALDERDERLASQAAEMVALQQRNADAAAQARSDAARYRDLVLAREPELPADLVMGDSVEAIEASLQQARQTVAQVRQHLEQQAQALRVPAGAPVRAAPDISGLSSAEKIRLGLQQ